MRKKLSILITSIVMLFIQEATCQLAIVDHLPSETIVLKLPTSDCAHWKELSRKVTEKQAAVQRMPFNQTTENCSELLCMYYDEKSNFGESANSIDTALDYIKKVTLSYFPGKKFTWRVIEKNENDSIYEWILHQPYKDLVPQHEISRVILTGTGLHVVGFTRRNGEMSSDEREKWIKILTESASVISYEQAANSSEGLTIPDRLQNSLDLGPVFQSWIVSESTSKENGLTQVCLIPSWQIEVPITESLDVVTLPNLTYISLEQFFEGQKELVQKYISEKIEFNILKKSPTEVIYNYSYPNGNRKLNVIVRTFMSDQACYYICCKLGRNAEMKKEEILQWQGRLEMIKIRNGEKHLKRVTDKK